MPRTNVFVPNKRTLRCPACGRAPVADNPFGLCEPCAEREAAKVLETEQPPLFVQPRADTTYKE